ncbi:PspC domain-containing protein [Ramlibacter alkalitolerans]|uniref:PspC domain-containing protein n=1 Tax=Ramlibacter alkalitolerans TaxID=2039631 RepID=A0ABS1JUH9_9BURK|nr:PspC domain-containing protein [Ramlibacter alkalitolerans]MBL0427873.1 PspC domain-containing protein [Ramlibacter alkalitolerans]
MSLSDLKRDTRNGALGGVCAGLARYMDAPVWVLRFAAIFGLFFMGGTFWLYVIAWVLMPKMTDADYGDVKTEPSA